MDYPKQNWKEKRKEKDYTIYKMKMRERNDACQAKWQEMHVKLDERMNKDLLLQRRENHWSFHWSVQLNTCKSVEITDEIWMKNSREGVDGIR